MLRAILLSSIALLLLVACDAGTKQKLGLTRKSPDSTLVREREPLKIPKNHEASKEQQKEQEQE